MRPLKAWGRDLQSQILEHEEAFKKLNAENLASEKAFAAPPAKGKKGAATAATTAPRIYQAHAAKLVTKLSVPYNTSLQLAEKRKEIETLKLVLADKENDLKSI